LWIEKDGKGKEGRKARFLLERSNESVQKRETWGFHLQVITSSLDRRTPCDTRHFHSDSFSIIDPRRFPRKPQLLSILGSLSLLRAACRALTCVKHLSNRPSDIAVRKHSSFYRGAQANHRMCEVKYRFSRCTIATGSRQIHLCAVRRC
jgi:hypothetical protein